MARARLTKRLIDTTRPGEGTTITWDSDVRGLGLRMTRAGAKSFVLTYRTTNGTQRRMTLGRYGSDLTLDQARRLARRRLAEVAEGGDPLGDRYDARAAPTLNDLLDRFDREHVPTLKPKTQYEYRSIIKRHLRPRVGRTKLETFDLSAALKLHRGLKDTPRAANLALSILSSALTFAERIGWRPVRSNPCAAVRRYPERQVHRPLCELETARLAKVLREAETGDPPEAAEDPRAVAALRLLMFTGMRRNEALRLRWDEVDLPANVLRLRDSKTGEKLVRLNSAAREVITAQEPMLGNPYVFPSPRKPGAPLYDVKGVWQRVRRRACLEDVRLHDLRHNFAAAAAAGGLSLHQIGQLLGHRNPSTTARYSDLTDDPAQQASELVGQALEKAMGQGGER